MNTRDWTVVALMLLAGGACGQDARVYLGSDSLSDAPAARDAGPEPQVPVRDLETDVTSATEPGAAATTPQEPLFCDVGRADCDGDRSNGCEVNLSTDAAHCGECGAACTAPGCVCRDGVRILECPPGLADCDDRFDNGCETNVMDDASHCGSCELECHDRGTAVASARCELGVCVLTCEESFFAPRGDCDGLADTGCEARLWTDENNCGGCGVACDYCDDGVCW
ncbi:MAG: hypothetical protein OXR73_33180 [Myxococcales bacterium]|nr:hypothetical protein [Myxococcales bacterium]